MIAFYVVVHFVAIFFKTALVGAAMNGGIPTLRDWLTIDWARPQHPADGFGQDLLQAAFQLKR